MPSNSPVFHWWHWMREATANTGKPIDYPEDSERLLEEVGFDVVKHNRITVRASPDRNMDDLEPQNLLAVWYRHTMFHPAYKTITGLCTALFTHQLGWNPQQISALCIDVQRALNLPHCPWYHKL